MWVDQNITVEGRDDWLFVKLHTHGANDEVSQYMFDEGAFEKLCETLEERFNDGERYVLHYVTSREMYNIAKAAEAGESGNPNQFRNYVLPQPPLSAQSEASQTA